MVRIKVIRKTQLISGALIILLISALLIGGLCAWRYGLFEGGARAAANAPTLRATGGVAQIACAGAATASGADAAPLSASRYVINLDFSAEQTVPPPDAINDSGEMTAPPTSQPTAAALSDILNSGLKTGGAQFIEVSAGAGALCGKRILIYHTHTHESYEKQTDEKYAEISAYRTKDAGYSVVRVGDELTRLLISLGAQVDHDTTDYEQDALATAYGRSLAMLEKLKNSGANYDLWIDLHRDAYSKEGSGDPFSVNIDGQDVVRLMVLLGTGEGTSGGEAFAVKPNFERNLYWGRRLTDALNKLAPGICRPVMVRSGRYNQHISERCLLIEVGHNRNSLAQALASMPYLARAICETLA